MDSTSLSPQANLDLSKLSDADKRDLQQQVSNEMQKAKIQDSIHSLTDICWTKCMTGGISSGKLSGKEETCAQNCVERFLDANTAVLKHLEMLRGDM
ncbi:MAG: hypothetical protein LQ338_006937 [Usnochroma carphineum]|nr:MAG: hypothetical protein LQ338_006937 [Usnochroma carphineum]